MSARMATIGLVNPKTPANVGAVLRAAGCYGASMVAIAGGRGHAMAMRAPTDTSHSVRSIPTIFVDQIMQAHPAGAVPIAVDLVDDAESLVTFQHPPQAFYIFGPEDGTLGGETLKSCARRVFVPTRFCMNLAATVNVVLYDRIAKELRR